VDAERCHVELLYGKNGSICPPLSKGKAHKKVVPKTSAVNGLTLNELNTLTAVELNTVTPVNVNGLNQVEVRGLTRVRFNGVAPLRRNGVAPIEVNDLTPAVFNGVAPIETNNLTPIVLNNLTNGSIFFKLPREIRDKIYGLVLLNPIAPKWKGIGHERDVQYMNYLNHGVAPIEVNGLIPIV
jgi:hypothetical protein